MRIILLACMFLGSGCEYVLICCLFFNRKGDYFRYLAEFKATDDRKDAADQSLKAYEVCEIPHFSCWLFSYFDFIS